MAQTIPTFRSISLITESSLPLSTCFSASRLGEEPARHLKAGSALACLGVRGELRFLGAGFLAEFRQKWLSHFRDIGMAFHDLAVCNRLAIERLVR